MLNILRKCRLNQYLSNDTKQDPPLFSLDSTFNSSHLIYRLHTSQVDAGRGQLSSEYVITGLYRSSNGIKPINYTFIQLRILTIAHCAVYIHLAARINISRGVTTCVVYKIYVHRRIHLSSYIWIHFYITPEARGLVEVDICVRFSRSKVSRTDQTNPTYPPLSSTKTPSTIIAVTGAVGGATPSFSLPH